MYIILINTIFLKIKIDNNSVFKKYSYISEITNKECINSKLYDEGSVNEERFDIFLRFKRNMQ